MTAYACQRLLMTDDELPVSVILLRGKQGFELCTGTGPSLGFCALDRKGKNRLRVPRDAVTDLTFSEHMHKKDGG